MGYAKGGGGVGGRGGGGEGVGDGEKVEEEEVDASLFVPNLFTRFEVGSHGSDFVYTNLL